MYSQNNEEEIVLTFFGTDYKGCFLDVGAYHPTDISNTRRLYEIGWKGVMVEPAPSQFMELLKAYGKESDRIILVNAAVAESQGLKFFYYSPDWASTLSKIQVDRSPGHDFSRGYWLNTIPVSWLQRYGPFDFISIDAEAVDWEIACGLTDSMLASCRMICVEHAHHSDDDWKRLFGPFGFRLHAVTPENRIFTR